MKVTNLTERVLGLDGIINFKPKESRQVPETNDLMERVMRLKNAGMVHVEFDEVPEAPVPTLVDVVVPPVQDTVPEPEQVQTQEDVTEAPVEEVVEEATSEVSVTTTKKSKKANSSSNTGGTN